MSFLLGAGASKFSKMVIDHNLPPANINSGQKLGFISPMSDPHFCETCNRARLTARGGLRACLADDREINLKDPLRAGLYGPALHPFIDEALNHKRPQHLMNMGIPPQSVMTALGG